MYMAFILNCSWIVEQTHPSTFSSVKDTSRSDVIIVDGRDFGVKGLKDSTNQQGRQHKIRRRGPEVNDTIARWVTNASEVRTAVGSRMC
jgi:hypothetical protein